jgi:NADPH2:quinone reductase
MKTLDCIAPRGMAVSFGNASGSVPPIDLALLSSKGSLKLTRPTLMTYALNRSLLEPMSVDLFDRVIKGQIKIEIKQRYPLADAVQAHRDLEARKTTGTTILIP